MSEPREEALPKVKPLRLLLFIGVGVAISLYLIITSFDPKALSHVGFTPKLVLGLFLSLLAVVVRDFAFMYKLRLSTGEKLTWLRTLEVVLMWEFGAAITPKLGEVAFSLFVLKKSGISYGKSTAAILLNAFLDNIAFVVVFGILYAIMGHRLLAVSGDCPDLINNKVLLGVRGLADKAWIGCVAICCAALFFGLALFAFPHAAKRLFHWLAGTRLLSRLKDTLTDLGDEIEQTSAEYRNQTASFWIRMTAATFINWTARYMLANALIFAFSTGHVSMLDVYARQYMLWIFLIVPTTPGASGVAEISFIALNCEFMPVGLSAAIALMWRIYSYYIYLVIGMIILPKWANATAKD